MSTISASTTSTTAYKVTADTTGTLVLQTGSSPTTAVTIDTSQNVGIGVTPSAWTGYTGFDLKTLTINSGTTNGEFGFNYYYGSGYKYKGNGYAGQIAFATGTGGIAFNIAGNNVSGAGAGLSFTQAMTLDASGNLGVGTTSPSAKLHTYVASGNTSALVETGGSTAQAAYTLKNVASGYVDLGCDAYGGYLQTRSAVPFLFYTNATERARIDTSGNLLVGQTSRGNVNSLSFDLDVATGTFYSSHNSGSSSGLAYSAFGYNGTTIGSITQNGTTGVLYNTSSDYRLKTVIGAASGFGERIDALEPIEYEWKANGERTRGFLAHKFQEVYPQSVSGEKDAVDADGNPVYQNMQASTSEVIADLVAEIQSLRKRITALENK